MVNKYSTEQDIVTSKLSGGRYHHTFRPLVVATETYDYTIGYGDSFHKLSTPIFGSDQYWWILHDINKPRNAFKFKIGNVIKLPMDIVRDGVGVKKFFF